MLDRNAFMETLRSVAEIRRASLEPLSREEILNYFSGMELTEEQIELIYEYMKLSPEEQTAEPQPEEEEPEEVRTPVPDEEEEQSYFQLYLEELSRIEELSLEQMEEAYEKLLAGDGSVIGRIAESWLPVIAQLAVPFAERGVNLEDVIQEGNMGLLIKLSELQGAGEIPAVSDILQGSVIAAMEEYIAEDLLEQGDK